MNPYCCRDVRISGGKEKCAQLPLSQTFASIAEGNAAIPELFKCCNGGEMRKVPKRPANSPKWCCSKNCLIIGCNHVSCGGCSIEIRLKEENHVDSLIKARVIVERDSRKLFFHFGQHAIPWCVSKFPIVDSLSWPLHSYCNFVPFPNTSFLTLPNSDATFGEEMSTGASDLLNDGEEDEPMVEHLNSNATSGEEISTSVAVLVNDGEDVSKKRKKKESTTWSKEEAFDPLIHAGIIPGVNFDGNTQEMCPRCTFIQPIGGDVCAGCDYQTVMRDLRTQVPPVRFGIDEYVGELQSSDVVEFDSKMPAVENEISYEECDSWSSDAQSESSEDDNIAAVEYRENQEALRGLAKIREEKKIKRKKTSARKLSVVPKVKKIKGRKKERVPDRSKRECSEFWRDNCGVDNFQDSKDMWLVMFSPLFLSEKDSLDTAANVRTNLSLTNSESVIRYTREIHALQKSDDQIRIIRRLDAKLHGGANGNGVDAIEQVISNMPGGPPMIRYANSNDYLYDGDNEFRPIVVNTQSVKGISGEAIVLENRKAFLSLLTNIGEILSLSKYNHERNVMQVNFGYSPNQANRMRRRSQHQSCLAGFTEATHKASAALRTAIGEHALYLSNDVTTTLLSDTPLNEMFVNDETRMDLFMNEAYDMYNVPLNKRSLRFDAQLAIHIHGLPDNECVNDGQCKDSDNECVKDRQCKDSEELGVHYDNMDDHRKNHDAHIGISSTFVLDDLNISNEVKEELKKKYSLPTKLHATAIFYTRDVMSVQCKFSDAYRSLERETSLQMYLTLTNDLEEWKDVELFDHPLYNAPILFKNWCSEAVNVKVKRDERFTGAVYPRKESCTQSFNISGWVDGLLLFFSNQSYVPLCYGALRDVQLFASECQGTFRVSTILSVFARNESSFPFGDGTFRRAWELCSCFYKLMCYEAIKMNENRKGADGKKLKYNTNSDFNRMQISGDLSWKPIDGDNDSRYKNSCFVLDRCNMSLRRTYRYDKEAADAVFFDIVKSIGGLGDMKAQNVIRFGAILGLVPHHYFAHGHLEMNPNGKSGAVKFMRKYGDFGKGPGETVTAEDLVNEWGYVLEDLRSTCNLKGVSGATIDQTGCAKDRSDRVDIRGEVDRRKVDPIIWWEKGNRETLMNIFRYKYNCNDLNNNRFEFRCHGEWKQLRDIVGIVNRDEFEKNEAPTYEEPWLQWLVPKWHREGPELKQGMARAVFPADSDYYK